MIEILRAFEFNNGDGEVTLKTMLKNFPGTFRFYCTMKSGDYKKIFVEFHADDGEAADKFLAKLP